MYLQDETNPFWELHYQVILKIPFAEVMTGSRGSSQ